MFLLHFSANNWLSEWLLKNTIYKNTIYKNTKISGTKMVQKYIKQSLLCDVQEWQRSAWKLHYLPSASRTAVYRWKDGRGVPQMRLDPSMLLVEEWLCSLLCFFNVFVYRFVNSFHSLLSIVSFVDVFVLFVHIRWDSYYMKHILYLYVQCKLSIECVC